MRVLVFGVSGFIGHEAALALVRSGHDVIGTTRSAQVAKQLEAEEIEPKVCEVGDVSTWRSLISAVDVVIDCSGGPDIMQVGHLVLNTCIEEAKKSRPNGPPLSYIYCSGTWVHGDDRTANISDRTPLHSPMPLTAWRLGIEQQALSAISRSFTANVIRPSVLYGQNGSLFQPLLESAKSGAITWIGDEGTRLATVHKTDLGEAFRLCAEKSYAVPGVIFDISNDYPESIRDILRQLQLASGAKSIEYKKPESDYHRALNATALLRPQLAKSLLGWSPKRAPLAEGMQTYYRAYLASNA